MSKKSAKVVRRSISLSPTVDSKVQKLARHHSWSTNRAYETVIEAGIEAKEAEKRRFFELGERLQKSTDKTEIAEIKKELGRMIFGA